MSGRVRAKFMDSPDARRQRAVTKLEGMLPDLAALLASVKATA